MSKPTVLIVEDEHALASALGASVTRLGAVPKYAPSGSKALESLEAVRPSAMVLDIGLPDMGGLQILERAFPDGVDLPVLVVTAHGSLENAIAAKRLGVAEYLAKPLDLHAFEEVLGGLLSAPGQPVAEGDVGTTMIGASSAMQQVFREVAHACATKVPVLIGGASGTGKSLAARVIHANSDDGGELEVLECGEASADQVDALFSRRGDRRGTLLLENVDRLPREAQAALVSAVEGEEKLRLISTSRAPLHESVSGGGFREDLYYRLRGVEIRLPSLEERGEDIPALAAFFLGRASSDRNLTLSDEALEVLRDREWPGNIWELRNAVEYGVSVCGGNRLLPQHLPPMGRGGGSDRGGLDAAIGRWLESEFDKRDEGVRYSDLLDDVERALLAKLLKRFGGKPTRLAAEMGMNRTTLRKRLERLGVD